MYNCIVLQSLDLWAEPKQSPDWLVPKGGVALEEEGGPALTGNICVAVQGTFSELWDFEFTLGYYTVIPAIHGGLTILRRSGLNWGTFICFSSGSVIWRWEM